MRGLLRVRSKPTSLTACFTGIGSSGVKISERMYLWLTHMAALRER